MKRKFGKVTKSRGYFPVNICQNIRRQLFCTFYNKISFLQFSARHFVLYLTFRSLPLFYHRRTGSSLTFHASIFSSCKHNGAIFYQQRNPFNFVLNMFSSPLNKSKVNNVNYPYFAKLYKCFVGFSKLLKKSSDLLLLDVTNVTLELRFMKINKFYYDLTAKVVNSEDVSF